ncbi:MAG: 4-hydroxy-tetrahydrodipicolinate synthase [Clostridiales bacterium]|nr:4-hydroxy-tetrahydrodipicolinate synthase [Clostridiales bacterium]
MSQRIFTGSCVAIITPFTKSSVDYEALKVLIDFQINNGTDAILICGTTGESSTMPDEEHKEVIRFTVEYINKRVPVIANTGSNHTTHAIELSQYAEKVGADAILSVSPYYNKTTQAGLIAHFTTIANGVNLPMLIYNVPSRTGINVDANTLIELSTVKNIVGVKECNLDQAAKVISKTNDDFTVYSGEDGQLLPFLSLGAQGVISVVANVAPTQTHDICKYYLDGNIKKSREMFYETYELAQTLFIENNPIPCKTAVNMMGLPGGLLRLPLIEMSNKNKEILHSVMRKLELI